MLDRLSRNGPEAEPMKRALIACVAVGFVVAVISIARGHTGQSQPSEATTSTSADVSRPFDRELTTEQIKKQADQVLQAQADIAKDVAELANDSAHSLIVTIREERPGKVWVVGKIDGKPACVTPPKDIPTYVEVTPMGTDMQLASHAVPTEATLLKSGACRASIELFVPLLDGYQIKVARPGHPFGLAKVARAERPQRVTIVG